MLKKISPSCASVFKDENYIICSVFSAVTYKPTEIYILEVSQPRIIFFPLKQIEFSKLVETRRGFIAAVSQD